MTDHELAYLWRMRNVISSLIICMVLVATFVQVRWLVRLLPSCFTATLGAPREAALKVSCSALAELRTIIMCRALLCRVDRQSLATYSGRQYCVKPPPDLLPRRNENALQLRGSSKAATPWSRHAGQRLKAP
jgi:hypothetical protein